MKGMIQQDGLPQEPAKKKEKPLSLFGSFTAALNDGMMLSFSNYGNQGKSPAAGKNNILKKNVVLKGRIIHKNYQLLKQLLDM